MRNKAKAFLQLPRSERILLIEALCALGRARLALILRPFRRIAASLGEIGAESAASVSPEHDAIARQVGWAVETMARHVPWDSLCLAQAIAAWMLLQRRGISWTVYIGVAQNTGKPFEAHAWLRCGERLVTGGNGHEQYQVVASFSHSTGATPRIH